MRWLVTGAGGFIGQHLARGLARAGHDVIAVTRHAASPLHHAAITPVSLDIRNSIGFDLPQPVDAVLHCAALSPADGGTDDEMKATNVEGSAALAAWSARQHVPYFIHLSAVSIYGAAEGCVNEATAPVNPDAYGQSKQEAEERIKMARGSLPSLSLRLPGVLGRGARNPWLAQVLENLRHGKPVFYFNGDAPFNNAVYIDDLKTFILYLADRPCSQPCLLLAAATSLPVKEVVGRIKTLAGSSSALEEKPAPRPAFHLDCALALSCGYRPMTLETMLETYVATVSS